MIGRRQSEALKLQRDWFELGQVQALRFDFSEALMAFDRAIGLYRTRPELGEGGRLCGARALCGKAECLMRHSQWSDSLEALGEAISVYPIEDVIHRISESEVGALFGEVVRASNYFVSLVSLQGLMARAVGVIPMHDDESSHKHPGVSDAPSYEAGFKLLKLRPNSYWPRLAEGTHLLAITSIFLSDSRVRGPADKLMLWALGFEQIAVEFNRVLAREEPTAFTAEFGLSLNNLADIAIKVGIAVGRPLVTPNALRVATEAVSIYRDLRSADPGLAMCLDTLGEALEAKGIKQEALSTYREGIERLQRHFNAPSPVDNRALLVDLLKQYKRLALELKENPTPEFVLRADELVQQV